MMWNNSVELDDVRTLHLLIEKQTSQGVDVAAWGAELQLQLSGRRDAAAAPCI